MKKTLLATNTLDKRISSAPGVKVGKIVEVDGSGQILVNFAENPSGPVVARITASVKRDILGKGNPSGREVLLAFENNDPRRPIIVDAMYSLIDELTQEPPVADDVEAPAPKDAIIDGKRIVFDAEEEVVLRCGKASITLTKAGKVLIRGEYVLSRSSGPNKIKGGSIQLN